MTPEKLKLLQQTAAFVRLRRQSRKATAAEVRAALDVEELIERELLRGAGQAPRPEEVSA